MATKAAVDAGTLYLALTLTAIVLLSSSSTTTHENSVLGIDDKAETTVRGKQFSAGSGRPCDEIYVVGEGETLHTISDKCGDPFIVERNPHIHDPDDVFPGLVIKITPSGPTEG